MRISEIKALMARYGLRPNKGLGQNFLVDPVHLERIVAAAELRPDDTVLEIGPGLGALTEKLLETVDRVIAVELDQGFVRILADRFGDYSTFTLHHRDILESDLPTVLAADREATPPSYKVVANIPYYITSAVMRHLLESRPLPQLIVLLVQREVAQRITAAPGDLSLLAISVQFYGRPELVATVPAGAFYPSPKVDSAILRVRPYAEPKYHAATPDFFWTVVKAGFSQKRKQLKNSLTAGLSRFAGAEITRALEAAGIEPSRRPQTLAIEEWLALYEALEGMVTGDR